LEPIKRGQGGGRTREGGSLYSVSVTQAACVMEKKKVTGRTDRKGKRDWRGDGEFYNSKAVTVAFDKKNKHIAKKGRETRKKEN